MQLRLFAPFLPFVTEEVWSWWQEGSVHRPTWPDAERVAAPSPRRRRRLCSPTRRSCSAAVRKAKSEAKTSMRTEVRAATVTGPAEALDRVGLAAADLQATGRVGELAFAPSDDALGAAVTL